MLSGTNTFGISDIQVDETEAVRTRREEQNPFNFSCGR
jgi:hypothetical protein